MFATSSRFIVRPALKADVPDLFRLIQALADYEQLSHAVTGDSASLEAHLFGANPCIEALIAECAGGAVGFALFFQTYSTFLTQPGIYLEDLFVLSEYRGCGIGKALLTQVAKIAVQRGCGRFEWSVLDWNEPAIAFYTRMGAEILPDWRICRVSSDRLAELGNVPQTEIGEY